MRARLLHSWPALSELYGLHPWDLELLSPLELNAYLDDLQAKARAARQGGKRR